MRTIAGLRYSIKTRYIDKLYLPDYVFGQGREHGAHHVPEGK